VEIRRQYVKASIIMFRFVLSSCEAELLSNTSKAQVKHKLERFARNLPNSNKVTEPAATPPNKC
jgi:hypothetical protein